MRAREKFDSQRGGVYSPPDFPPGLVLCAPGEGVSEEGGKGKEPSLLSSEAEQVVSMRKVRTML